MNLPDPLWDKAFRVLFYNQKREIPSISLHPNPNLARVGYRPTGKAMDPQNFR